MKTQAEINTKIIELEGKLDSNARDGFIDNEIFQFCQGLRWVLEE